jgi:hypothetical protein
MGLQEGWRWCKRCQVLAHSALGNGICWDGEGHDFTESGHYSVHFAELPPEAQEGWRWCKRCQDLAYSGFGNGVCWDGEPHSFDESGSYGVHLDAPAADSRQDGWRWCERCQVLAHSALGNGICWDGEAHSFNGSGNYSVTFGDPAPAPASEPEPELTSPRLAVEVSEQGNKIYVDGTGFTPGGRVAIGFVRGSETKNVEVDADGAGAIGYVERDTRPTSGDGLVLCRDISSGEEAAGHTQRLFPRSHPESVQID